MSYLGDYAEDYATLNVKFPTTSVAGVPTVLTNGVIKVYKGSATGTESTAGITLAADFDGVVGLNNVLIDLSADAFYATGQDYAIIITTGTVDSVSVVGAVVGLFSIENRFTNVDKWSGTAVTLGNSLPDVNVSSWNDSTVSALQTVSDILTTQMTEAYAADGVAPTMAQSLMMIQQTLTEFSISGTTWTTKKIDGTTTAATGTLSDGDDPTSLTRAT